MVFGEFAVEDEAAVGAVVLHEVLVGALLDDSSMINNEDAVGFLNGGQAVRNHQ